MIDEKEIVARLKNGETLKDIGDSLAAILNAANATYQKEKSGEKRKAALISILSELLDWYEAWYEPVDDIDVHQLADMTLETIEGFKSLKSLFDNSGLTAFNKLNFDNNKNTQKVEKQSIDMKSLDELVRSFLGEA